MKLEWLVLLFVCFDSIEWRWPHLIQSETESFYKTLTWIHPLDFEIFVKIEVAGYVDNVHHVEDNLADGHHRDQGRGELGQRIHAGVIEDQAEAVYTSLLLVIDINEDIEEAVENAHDKKWKGKCIPLENPLNFVLETCANVNESIEKLNINF